MHRNIGVGSWIARRARITPDRAALIFGDRNVTYRELDDRITRLARALDRLRIGDGERVAFVGHNHPAALEVVFACGLLGAIAVPIHPGLDDASLLRALSLASPMALVITPALLPRLRRLRAAIGARHWFTTGEGDETTEPLEDVIATSSDEPIDRPIGLDQTCLLAFSSGTTARNKAVQLTHGNVLFNAVNTLGSIDYVGNDVFLSSAPLYRMGGLGFTLTVLFKGGTCVLHAGGDAESSLRLIEQHRVTILFENVGALEAIQAAPSFSTADLSSLRTCVTGGSHVPTKLLDAFHRRGLHLRPGYGLTEAAPVALIADRDEAHAHPAAAGRPVLFCAARVVDAELEDVAPGEVGELLLSGPNVTPGYWRDPLATSEAFVDGWLRTGDAALTNADGTLSVIGRIADGIVLGGKRFHPGPIEDELCERGGLVDCAIVQTEPDALPVVFAVQPGDRQIDRDTLLAICRARLGPAVLPALRIVDALPRNSNGKLLRNELRATCNR